MNRFFPGIYKMDSETWSGQQQTGLLDALRTHEIGIRIALDAQSADVLKMIVGEATRLGLGFRV